jgi:hypothetical protein
MKIIKVSGIFYAPRQVVNPIRRYIIDVYKSVAREDIRRITAKKFPPRDFTLDFSGTQLEELNNLSIVKRTISVEVSLSSSGTSYAIPAANKILINLAEGLSFSILETIEHELMHIIQEWIAQYKKFRGLGGLIPGKFRDLGYDVEGYKKNKDKKWNPDQKRRKHEEREVEKYPRFISMVRNLQYVYLYMREKMGSDMWKKEFLEYFLHDPDLIKDQLSKEDGVKSDKNILRHFKFALSIWEPLSKKSGEYKEWILKTLYDSFVNRDENFDFSEIYGGQKEEELLRIEKREKDKSVGSNTGFSGTDILFYGDRWGKEIAITREVFEKLGSESILSYDFGYNVLDIVGLEDENHSYSEVGEYFADRLPYISDYEDRWGSYYIKIGLGLKEVKAIFKRLDALSGDEYSTVGYKEGFRRGVLDLVVKKFRDKHGVTVKEEEILNVVERG